MVRAATSRGQRNRVRIAQAAARLIAEHGLVDWSSAKRKACRELGLAENEALPSNDEIEQALRDYNTLFRADAQAVSLREQRRLALDWMERLAPWNPLLIGGVAAGWATPHSEVRLELEAEDPKAVELSLINGAIDYQAGDVAHQSATQLVAGRGARTVRLVIVSPVQRRSRPRRDEDARLDAAQLKALLGAEPTSTD